MPPLPSRPYTLRQPIRLPIPGYPRDRSAVCSSFVPEETKKGNQKLETKKDNQVMKLNTMKPRNSLQHGSGNPLRVRQPMAILRPKTAFRRHMQKAILRPKRPRDATHRTSKKHTKIIGLEGL
jgi:hypothetical protein